MRDKNLSLFGIVSSHGIMHAYLVILPALLPLVKADLGNIQTISFLASLVFLFYGWGSLPAGFLADRYSKKTLIVASIALCGASSALVGFSQSLPMAAFSFILLGVGASLYHPPGYAMISLFSLEMRGRYMGLQGLGGEIGMALAYITSVILGVFFGWRITFMLWGLLGMIMATINFLVITETEEKRRFQNGSKLSINHTKYLATSPEMSYSRRLSSLALVFVIVICSGALWNGVSSFILTYINEAKGLQLILAGGLSTISYTVGSLGQVVGGELSDRYGRRIILQLGFSTFAGFLLLITLIPSSVPLILLVVSMLGFTFYLTQSPLNALISDVSSAKTVGVTYGFNFAIKYGIGGFSPVLAGFLAQNYSMDYAFYLFAFIAVVAFSVSLITKDVRKRR